MANFDRRRYGNRDWNDENDYRNRGSSYDPDYQDSQDYRRLSTDRGFNNQGNDYDRMSGRGQMSGSDYDYGSNYGGRGYQQDWNRDFNRGSRIGGSDYYDRGFRAGGNSDYYGRNNAPWGDSDYPRDRDDYNNSNMGSSSQFQGRNSGAWGGSDYDRQMGSGRQSYSQGRDWGSSQGSNQGQNWGDQNQFRGGNQSQFRGGQGQNWGSQSGNQSQYGEHYGRGPEGYKRSDDRIKEDVNDRLTWHGNVDATHITVSVKNGEVTLEGTVNDRYQKRMAEDTAEQVQGVSDVQNRLRVQNEAGDYSSTSSSSTSGKRSSTSQSKSNQENMGQVANGKPREQV